MLRLSVEYPDLSLVFRFSSCVSFYSILNELNDYAGQREVVAEEMGHNVYGELMRYSQDLKSERKHVSGFSSRTLIPGCTYCRLNYVQCCYVVYSLVISSMP